jgi:hypothetical protein
MEERFNYAKAAPGTYKAMLALEQYLHKCGLEESLLHLIKLRTSQISIAARIVPGTYQPAKAHELKRGA